MSSTCKIAFYKGTVLNVVSIPEFEDYVIDINPKSYLWPIYRKMRYMNALYVTNVIDVCANDPSIMDH